MYDYYNERQSDALRFSAVHGWAWRSGMPSFPFESCLSSRLRVARARVLKSSSSMTKEGVAIYVCGSNEHASLCLPRLSGSATPERLLALRSLYVRCVGAGDGWSVCATSGGVLYAWGRNELPIPVGELPSGCSALACGPAKAYLLNDEGQVLVWRYATRARGVERVHLPVDVVQLSCGGAHVMALSDSGDLFSWGRGTEGQLGRPPPLASKDPSPKRVEGLATTVVAVACGYAHSTLVTAAGRLLGCGLRSCLALCPDSI